MEQSNEQEPNSNETLPEELSELEKKEIIWEENHEKIAQAIRYIQRKEADITVTNIAAVTKLSRKTIYKHLNQDEDHALTERTAHIKKLMTNEVINRLWRKACYGDMQAAKLYLAVMGTIKPISNTINTNLVSENKTILVNGHALTDTLVQNLSPENLSQLEEFVKAASQKANHGLQNIKNIPTNNTENQHVDG